MEIELWTLFDALMKWVIIPVAAVLWVHNQKLGSHEKEVLRIMTLLAERKDQRDEDRAELKEALRDLRAAILRLDQRLADFALAQSYNRFSQRHHAQPQAFQHGAAKAEACWRSQDRDRAAANCSCSHAVQHPQTHTDPPHSPSHPRRVSFCMKGPSHV